MTFVAGLVLLVSALPVAAQESGGESLRGGLNVRDDDGAQVPVVGVSISVVDADGVEVAATVTDDDGRFALVLPGPGTGFREV